MFTFYNLNLGQRFLRYSPCAGVLRHRAGGWNVNDFYTDRRWLGRKVCVCSVEELQSFLTHLLPSLSS